MILRKNARIYVWLSESGDIVRVLVTDIPGIYHGSLSLGECYTDWLNGDPSMTPEGAFADLLELGLDSRQARIQAALEFAKIEGCEWAALMVASWAVSDDHD